MTTEELASYEAILEATGLHFAKSIGKGGNLERLEEIPWGEAIVRVMHHTGWRIVDSRGEPVDVTPLRLEP